MRDTGTKESKGIFHLNNNNMKKNSKEGRIEKKSKGIIASLWIQFF